MLEGQDRLEQRVVAAAEAALARSRSVSLVDVLVGLRWLPQARVDEWRQGRIESLEDGLQVGPAKLAAAVDLFRRFAEQRGLTPLETAQVTRTRERRPLRFSVNGDPVLERAYRTQWVSPEMSDRRREQLAERASRPPDLVVVSPLKDWSCTECAGSGEFLLMEGSGPLCMTCADMDHLVFLPAGDAALTRRAKKGSGLSAVVVRFSRSRGRYERQGILVEEAALERAERECLADEEARARRRLRDAERRDVEDVEFQRQMAAEIRRLFPACPEERAASIARHAGTRRSGRVGRSAAGRRLDPPALELAVAASVRHEDTRYDELLMSGTSRFEARDLVRADVERVLSRWRG